MTNFAIGWMLIGVISVLIMRLSKTIKAESTEDELRHLAIAFLGPVPLILTIIIMIKQALASHKLKEFASITIVGFLESGVFGLYVNEYLITKTGIDGDGVKKMLGLILNYQNFTYYAYNGKVVDNLTKLERSKIIRDSIRG